VADFLTKRGFYIGCHQDLKKDDLDYVVDCFYQYIQKHHQ
jgi:dTDP-4-amino-4,6-dideoxygalactose transaminase